MALSARGVAGEASHRAKFDEYLRKHGDQVPHYNVYGQQHHRLPYKSKGGCAGVTSSRKDWERTPAYATRSEMLQARRLAKHPDVTFDVDGDGVVGPSDYFIATQFSKEKEHRLNTAERRNVVDALESGWLDKYSFGHEAAGVNRHAVVQKRGKIITVDNVNDLAETYPAHYNAHHTPRFSTKTQMDVHKRAMMANSNARQRDHWDQTHPYKILEPPVQQESLLDKPQYTNIRQRAEQTTQELRRDAGLSANTTGVNPDRDCQTIGLTWRDRPAVGTRLELREERKRTMLRDLAEARRQGEKDYVPRAGRHDEMEAYEHELRQGNANSQTFTKIKQARRAEFIEHNMRHFNPPPKEQPRFSDQDTPWFRLQSDYSPNARTKCLLHQLNEPHGEVADKVGTGASRPVASKGSTDQKDVLKVPMSVAPPVQDGVGSRTVPRWSSEFVPAVMASAVPRLFDGIKQAQTFSADTADLEQYSSFEPIAQNAIRRDRAKQRDAAKFDEERTITWRQNGLSMEVSEPSKKLESDLTSRRSSKARGGAASKTPVPVSRIRDTTVQIPNLTQLPAPVGEDPPMTERLCRVSNALASLTPRADLDQTSAPLRAEPPSESSQWGTEHADKAQTKQSLAAQTSATTKGMVIRSAGFQWIGAQTGLSVQDGGSVGSLFTHETP